MLIYANLRSPERDPGVQSAIIFYFFFILFFLLLLLFFLLFFSCPFRGITFLFLTSRKLYHMKFVIVDVARSMPDERYVIDVLVKIAPTIERKGILPYIHVHHTCIYIALSLMQTVVN